jgi:O-acetyl-ADP-ribose deacetylase (regulator of RNase III)
LPARYVIHTVGPVYRGAAESAPLLGAAFRSSLELARAHGLGSIAFPAISCGVFGYPLGEAAAIALGSCREHGRGLAIHFALFDEEALAAFTAAAEARAERGWR